MSPANKEKILLVSDESGGGAAVSCRRLRTWLRREGLYDCAWLSGTGGAQQPDIVAERRQDIVGIIIRRIAARFLAELPDGAKLKKRLGVWCNDRDMARYVRKERPSLVHLHNLHEYASLRFVKWIDSEIPIVWTLQDMWLMTGYCLHSFGCENYRMGCHDECPEMGRWGMALDDPGRVWERRDRFFRGRGRDLVLISPSKWLYRHARARFGDTLRIEHIPYGVDLEVFHPVDQRVARAALGLPQEGRIIVTGAIYLENKFKGFDYVAGALTMLRDRFKPKVTIVGFGDADVGRLPENWMVCGRIQDERLLNLYLAAADLFLMPSLAEIFGKVFIESMAAGTPCVCFDVGACGEIVRNEKTGFCTPCRDEAMLADAVERILTMSPERSHELRASCRSVAEREYSSELQVARYIALYEELLSTGQTKTGG